MSLVRKKPAIADLLLKCVFILLFVSSCAIIQESAIEDKERIIKEPVVRELLDTSSIHTIRSRIQSDKEAVLAGSLTLKDGVYSLSISEEIADSLGINATLYEKYRGMVELLNREKK